MGAGKPAPYLPMISEKYGETAVVDKLPGCQICQQDTAKYDARIKGGGPWGYMCQNCFDEHGVGLGVGKGQKLVVRTSPMDFPGKESTTPAVRFFTTHGKFSKHSPTKYKNITPIPKQKKPRKKKPTIFESLVEKIFSMPFHPTKADVEDMHPCPSCGRKGERVGVRFEKYPGFFDGQKIPRGYHKCLSCGHDYKAMAFDHPKFPKDFRVPENKMSFRDLVEMAFTEDMYTTQMTEGAIGAGLGAVGGAALGGMFGHPLIGAGLGGALGAKATEDDDKEKKESTVRYDKFDFPAAKERDSLEFYHPFAKNSIRNNKIANMPISKRAMRNMAKHVVTAVGRINPKLPESTFQSIVSEVIDERAKMHLDIKKGAYHKQKGIPADKKIPASTINADLHSKNPLTRRRANFARNAKKWHHRGKS